MNAFQRCTSVYSTLAHTWGWQKSVCMVIYLSGLKINLASDEQWQAPGSRNSEHGAELGLLPSAFIFNAHTWTPGCLSSHPSVQVAWCLLLDLPVSLTKSGGAVQCVICGGQLAWHRGIILCHQWDVKCSCQLGLQMPLCPFESNIIFSCSTADHCNYIVK